jgi:A/G-specific adenine glycosylase
MNPIVHDLLIWYDAHRRHLPWRDICNPYSTLISETMLQQTQVSTVISYFNRFMEVFPTLADLANAPEESVLKLWEGLGYYSRARNLLKGARQVMAQFGGVIPCEEKALLSISGIGPYTAGAIMSIAYNLPVPAVDGNVIRVLARLYAIHEDVAHKETLAKINILAHALSNNARPGDFNQALMDLGAGICSPGTPNCARCPLNRHCEAYKNDDADMLPVKTKKRPPKQMQVGVALITFENRILVCTRKEKMLGGLSVFFLNEEGSTKQEMLSALEQAKIPCSFKSDLGEAKHVFTHRVWHMHIYHFTAKRETDGFHWATRQELESLPFPTAMKAAKSKALEILSHK